MFKSLKMFYKQPLKEARFCSLEEPLLSQESWHLVCKQRTKRMLSGGRIHRKVMRKSTREGTGSRKREPQVSKRDFGEQNCPWVLIFSEMLLNMIFPHDTITIQYRLPRGKKGGERKGRGNSLTCMSVIYFRTFLFKPCAIYI